MAEFIHWLTVENTSHRKKLPNWQSLSFVLQVANLAYDKQVDVVWAGADGIWQTLAAEYLSTTADGAEIWQAQLRLDAAEQVLPGDVQFAVRLRVADQAYWDNGGGNNYLSIQHSGLRLNPALAWQCLHYQQRLADGQQSLELKLAVNQSLSGPPVVYWTKDNWQHSHHSRCRLHKSTATASTKIWSARLKPGTAFRVQYAIAYPCGTELRWDNNAGRDYQLSRKPLQVLILNLHCYQEQGQQEKFSQIAKAIDELEADIVCLQEVAEPWQDGRGDWPANAANIINQQLKQPFYLHYDWAHRGFDQYREGVAILSRQALLNPASGYVSDSTDVYNIHSRKVVTASLKLAYFGLIQVFSAHLSWWEDGFQQQFQRLAGWADSVYDPQTSAVLLCGDFNITAGSQAYWQVINDYHYRDAYLLVHERGLSDPVFRVNDSHWQHDFSEDYRIDYIFCHPRSRLRVTAARTVFTSADYGRVSDHCGYLMTFEPE